MFSLRGGEQAMMRVVALGLVILFGLSIFVLRTSPMGEELTAAAGPAWTEYRDAGYGFGLAVPGDWKVNNPPYLLADVAVSAGPNLGEPAGQAAPQKGMFLSILTMGNFGGAGSSIPVQNWPDGAIKIDLTVFDNIDATLPLRKSLRTYLEDEYQGIDKIKEQAYKSYRGFWVTTYSKQNPSGEKHKTLNFFLPTHQLLKISVAPETGWDDPNVKAMIDSLVLSKDESIKLPPERPVPSVISTSIYSKLHR